MATETTNYGFNKDEAHEYYNIEKINKNLDDIDAQVYGNSLVIDPYGLNLVSNKSGKWAQGYIATPNNSGAPYGGLVTNNITTSNSSSSECNISSNFFAVDPKKSYAIRDTGHFTYDLHYQLALYDASNNYQDFMKVDTGSGVFMRMDNDLRITVPDLPSNAVKARLTIYRRFTSGVPYTPIAPIDIEGSKIKIEEGTSVSDFTIWTAKPDDIAANIDFEQIIVGSEPKDPIVGTLWIDTRSTDNAILSYDGAYWVPVALYNSTDVAKQAKDNREEIATLDKTVNTHLAEDVTQEKVHGLQIEEGIWTPSLLFSGGNSGMQYSRMYGRYLKINKLVYIEADLLITQKGTSVGNATISGLPFTSSPTTPWRAVALGTYQGITLPTGKTNISMDLPASRSLIDVIFGGDRTAYVTNTALETTGITIRFEMQYMTE